MFCAAITGGIMAIYYKIKNRNPKEIIDIIRKTKNDPDVIKFVDAVSDSLKKESETNVDNAVKQNAVKQKSKQKIKQKKGI